MLDQGISVRESASVEAGDAGDSVRDMIQADDSRGGGEIARAR